MTALVLHCQEMKSKLLVLKANVEPQLRFDKETLKRSVRVAMSRFRVDSLTRHVNERDKTVAKTLNSRMNMHQNFQRFLGEGSKRIAHENGSDKGL